MEDQIQNRFAMRHLTEEELKLVQTAIIAKDLTVLEVIAEIYDHYITHLEGFSEEEFKSELAKLESIWIYPYCRDLQSELSNNVNKSIRSLQWKLIKSYFTWPKILSTATFFGFLYVLSQMLSAKVFVFSSILPFLIITQVFHIHLLILARKKQSNLRSIFNFKSTGRILSSAETNGLSVAVATPLSLLNLFLLSPRILDFELGISTTSFLFILVLFSFLISLISFSAYEAWKIKSKTALL
jgi:hypothetical protein